MQHPPVITLGKRGADKDLRTPSAELQAQGIAVVPIPRGGEATLHAPGQLVLYPLLELHRLRYGARRYIEGLEDFLIALCAERGIQAKVLRRVLLQGLPVAKLTPAVRAGPAEVPHWSVGGGPEDRSYWRAHLQGVHYARRSSECVQRPGLVPAHRAVWHSRQGCHLAGS